MGVTVNAECCECGRCYTRKYAVVGSDRWHRYYCSVECWNESMKPGFFSALLSWYRGWRAKEWPTKLDERAEIRAEILARFRS
jgi:hypothetical protein